MDKAGHHWLDLFSLYQTFSLEQTVIFRNLPGIFGTAFLIFLIKVEQYVNYKKEQEHGLQDIIAEEGKINKRALRY